MCPAVALYRFMYMVEEAHYEKRKRFTGFRIKKLINVVEKNFERFSLKYKAFGVRKIFEKGHREFFVSKIKESFFLKKRLCFEKLRRFKDFSLGVENSKKKAILIYESVKVLELKRRKDCIGVLNSGSLSLARKENFGYLLKKIFGKNLQKNFQNFKNLSKWKFDTIKNRQRLGLEMLKKIFEIVEETNKEKFMSNLELTSTKIYNRELIKKLEKLNFFLRISKSQKSKLRNCFQQLERHSNLVILMKQLEVERREFKEFKKLKIISRMVNLLKGKVDYYMLRNKSESFSQLQKLNSRQKFSEEKLTNFLQKIHLVLIKQKQRIKISSLKNLSEFVKLKKIMEIRLKNIFEILTNSHRSKQSQSFTHIKNHSRDILIKDLRLKKIQNFLVQKIISSSGAKMKESIYALKKYNETHKKNTKKIFDFALKSSGKFKRDTMKIILLEYESQIMLEEAKENFFKFLHKKFKKSTQENFNVIQISSLRQELTRKNQEIFELKKKVKLEIFMNLLEEKILREKYSTFSKILAENGKMTKIWILKNILHRIIHRKEKNALDYIFEESEFIRYRRINTGLTLLKKSFNRIQLKNKIFFKKIFFRKFENIWEKISVKKLVFQSRINFQTAFWKIREINRIDRDRIWKEEMKSEKEYLSKFLKIFEEKKIRKISLAFYKIAGSGINFVNHDHTGWSFAKGDENFGSPTNPLSEISKKDKFRWKH